MPTESLYPPFEVPRVDIWAFLFERDDKPFPDEQVIYCDADTDRSYTYAQVKSTAIEFGIGLKSIWEWRKGDVLALFTPNCVDTPAIIWGCHWAGGIVSPANPGYTAEELAFQLKDAGAKGLVTQGQFLAIAQEAAKQVGIAEDMIILIGDERDESRRFKHFTSIRNVAGTNRYRRTKLDPNKNLAFLVYSSGTTGHPKGVMLSHRNIISNILQLKAGEGENIRWNGGKDGKGDKVLAFLPFFHIYGAISAYQHEQTVANAHSRTQLLDSSEPLQWIDTNRHAQVRNRKVLRRHSEKPNYLRIRCSSDHTPTEQAPCH